MFLVFASIEPDGSLSKIQVNGGFNQGTFQSDADRDWYGSNNVKHLLYGKTKRPTGLGNNEADASLAVRSFDSIILTKEKPTKKGPLLLVAKQQGGRIIYLADVEKSKLSLKDYIAQFIT